MAGMMCDGNTLKTANVSDSKSYCEGQAYRLSGTLVGRPVTDNPHIAASDAGVAWIAGWTVANAAGGALSAAEAGCCATRGATVEANSTATGDVVPVLATDNNSVESVDITDQGGGYASAPVVTFSAAVGTLATGTAVLDNDRAVSITITEPGVYLDSELPITVSIAAP